MNSTFEQYLIEVLQETLTSVFFLSDQETLNLFAGMLPVLFISAVVD